MVLLRFHYAHLHVACCSQRDTWFCFFLFVFFAFIPRISFVANSFREITIRGFPRSGKKGEISFKVTSHSRPQRPRFFRSAPKITTFGWFQTRKSVNHGLPALLRKLRKFETIVVANGYKNAPSLRLRIFQNWPEVVILGSDRKNRRLWGREWVTSGNCVSNQGDYKFYLKVKQN